MGWGTEGGGAMSHDEYISICTYWLNSYNMYTCMLATYSFISPTDLALIVSLIYNIYNNNRSINNQFYLICTSVLYQILGQGLIPLGAG